MSEPIGVIYCLEETWKFEFTSLKLPWHSYTTACEIYAQKHINSLAPGRYVVGKNVMSANTLRIKLMGTSRETGLWWISQSNFHDKSRLVQAMAWCRQAQTITWANADADQCHHIASPGQNVARSDKELPALGLRFQSKMYEREICTLYS